MDHIPDHCGSDCALMCWDDASLDSVSVCGRYWTNRAPPLPTLQKIIFLSSMISLPITWILGITIAHRFNGAMLRAIPFFANMLPTTGLLWFSFILTRDEGGEFVWMTAYTGLLATLLGLGMIAALVSARQKQQTPNRVPGSS